jgi:polyphosphate glucokinase
MTANPQQLESNSSTVETNSAVPITLALDIGGSGIKGRCFRGPDEPVSDRVRIKTPRPATPEPMLEAIHRLLKRMHPFDRVSVGFPGVVMNGVAKSAPNLDGDWSNVELQHHIEQITQTPVRVVNDADMHGYGAIERRGVEMVITFGTGMGAALYVDGRLLPNLELGHHPFEKGMTYEERLGQVALDKDGKAAWNRRAERAFALLRQIFNFRVLYVGGGNARKLNRRQRKDIVVVANAIAFVGGVKLWDAT